ncbi:hypothetical protein ACFL0H_06710 [Thermodesulfobacteriota bacterium]
MKIFRRKASIIILAGVLAICLLYYLIIVSPALSRNRFLTTYIRKMETDYMNMKELKKEWDSFQDTRADAEAILRKRGNNFTLLSFLEGVAREQGIDHNIKYIKPVSFSDENGPVRLEGIEMKFDDIQIGQLTNFLVKIEYAGKLMNIKRIKIMRVSTGNIRSLEVILQVNTYSVNT